MLSTFILFRDLCSLRMQFNGPGRIANPLDESANYHILGLIYIFKN